MCFSIPKKIQTINENIATVENGQKVKLGDMKVKVGDYVLLFGDLVVDKIPGKNATEVRNLIKNIDEIHSSKNNL